MTLMALKAAADVNQVAADVKQAAENVNLGVKVITDVKKSKLWNQLWQGMWIDLIFEPLKWYSCSQIFSEQSYLKVDYPSLGRNRFIGYKNESGTLSLTEEVFNNIERD